MLPDVPPSFAGDARAIPYHVYASGTSPAGIAKLSSGRFHIYRAGALGTILPTASAILVSREFADVITWEVEDGWHAQEAVIFDAASGREVQGYVQLLVEEGLGPRELPSGVSGKRLWRYTDSHLFVSPDLMEVLRVRFLDVSFSMGFSEFAG